MLTRTFTAKLRSEVLAALIMLVIAAFIVLCPAVSRAHIPSSIHEYKETLSCDDPDPAQNVTFSYDSGTFGIGRLTGRTDPSGTYVFHYDTRGNLTREEKTISGVLYVTQYGYNGNNALTSITYPTGRLVTYTPDSTGRTAQVGTTINGIPKTLASSITYRPFGPITSLTYGNGLSLAREYDNQYRVSSITLGSVLGLNYQYYPDGNVLSIADVLHPTESVLDTPGVYAYPGDSNRLTGITGTEPKAFGYDPNGNTTSENVRTFVYDLSNQLVEVRDNGNLTAAYSFNGAGQRVKKVTQSGTRIFHYDLQGHLIAETDNLGATIAEYIYLGDQPLAAIRNESVCYYHNDHLGTPQVLTNDAGTVVWKALYGPFGKTQILTQTVENPLRFPGQYYDTETALHYNYYRTYHPGLGRYVTPDPIGLAGGVNLYGYVGGNPVGWVDPKGLWVGIDDVVFAGGGTIIGMAGRAVGDLITWNLSSWEDYAGAAVGGAAAGEVLLYTANPLIAGAVGGLAGSLTGQGLKNITGKQCGINLKSAGFDTAFGFLTGFIPGRPRIVGVNAGRGSDLQVFRQMATKASNGTIRDVSAATAVRMGRGAFYQYAIGQGAAAGAVGSTVYGNMFP